MTESSKPDRVYRDAATGEYVTEEYAREHPDTTVSEPAGPEATLDEVDRDSDRGVLSEDATPGRQGGPWPGIHPSYEV